MFDPYHRWLAIPQGQRPPTYYQLLGIAPNETDAEVIQEAALRQASHIRTYQTGRYAKESQALLNEIGQAKVTLLNPEKRKEYDARLGLTDTDGITPKADTEPPGVEPGAASVATADIWGRPGLLALAYTGLLLLGGLLAFWLSFTRP